MTDAMIPAPAARPVDGGAPPGLAALVLPSGSLSAAEPAMDASWTAHTGADVTLVEGSSFCVSDRTGNIAAHRPQGVFFLDTRIISKWVLSIDEAPLEPLAVVSSEPFATTFVGRAQPRTDAHDTTAVRPRVANSRWQRTRTSPTCSTSRRAAPPAGSTSTAGSARAS